MNVGVYSDSDIKRFIEKGFVKGEEINVDSQVQPSSLDLCVGNHFYCLPFSSRPPEGMALEDYFKEVANYDFNISSGKKGFLHKGSVYAVKVKESLALPEHISARANPKSSIGRIDLHTRLVSQGGFSFDNIPAGYNGELWLEIYPRSFDVEFPENTSLNQLRFMDSVTRSLTHDELVCLQRDCGIVYSSQHKRLSESAISRLISGDSVGMTANIPKRGLVGYVAKQNSPPIDMTRRDLPASLFFERVYAGKSGLIVDHDSFYILNSKETTSIPKSACAEMLDIDTGMGEFRGHYAGFFDPGFCAQAVLELRNYGQPFLLRDGQLVSGLKSFRMKQLPEISYGEGGLGSHYQGQKGPKLAKFFNNDLYGRKRV